MSGGITLASAIGWDRNAGWIQPVAIETLVPRFLMVFGILFVITLVTGFTRALTKARCSTTVICDQCHKMKLPADSTACECGGSFEDFFRWKWVKE